MDGSCGERICEKLPRWLIHVPGLTSVLVVAITIVEPRRHGLKEGVNVLVVPLGATSILIVKKLEDVPNQGIATVYR